MMMIGAKDLLNCWERNGSDLETTLARILKPITVVRMVKQKQQRKLRRMTPSINVSPCPVIPR